MVSLGTALSVIGILFSYIIVKHRMLKSGEELRQEIEGRLQPRYSITEPTNSKILPHTDWPENDFWFEVWHVEVSENRWGAWRKWLPRGSFSGRTIVHYRVHGPDLPSQDSLWSHHLAQQPYVRNIKMSTSEPDTIKVIYESVNPRNISLYVRQFRFLLRDTMFRELNPDADLQFEVAGQDEDGYYVRFFDAGRTKESK